MRAAVAASALLMLASCTGAPPADTLCTATRPLYLTDAAIAALGPHREVRVAIAAHNIAWERRCLR